MIPLAFPWIKVGGAAAVVLALGGWWHSHSERLRAEGRAEVLAARVDSLAAVADSVVQEVARVDSAAAQRVQRADSIRQWALRAQAEARERQPRIVERIREVVDTTALAEAVNAGLDSLVAEHDAERAAWERERAALVATIEVKDEQIAARDEAIGRIQTALDAALAARATAGATQPGFLERWGERAAYAVGGGVIGYLAGG